MSSIARAAGETTGGGPQDDPDNTGPPGHCIPDCGSDRCCCQPEPGSTLQLDIPVGKIQPGFMAQLGRIFPTVAVQIVQRRPIWLAPQDRKSTRLNSSH